jgi:signal transduction histidine kinase
VNIIPFLFLYLIHMSVTLVMALRSRGAKSGRLYLCALFMFIFWSPIANLMGRDRLFMPAILPNLFLVLAQCITLAQQYAETLEKERSLMMENALWEHTAKIRSDMIDTLSHEVRTPLSVMSVYAQLVARQIREGRTDEQTLADLMTISDEARRLSELASDTLRLSSLGDNSPKDEGHEPRSIDLGTITEQVSRIFAPMVRKAGRVLTTDLSDNLCVYGDADELTRLLWNILDNALIHSGHGDIEIKAALERDAVSVTVKDSGDGIPPEILSHVFERGVSGKDGGTGLGLAICMEIAERHGGRITATSELGKGAVFTLTLPIREGAE